MKLDEINNQVKSIRNLDLTDIWLTQETFNTLLEEANHICLNDEGIFILSFENGNHLGVSLNVGSVATREGNGNFRHYYSKLVLLNDYFKENKNAQGKYCEIL